MGIGTRIDKITNSIEDRISGLSIETSIIPLAKFELTKVKKGNGWKFNWRKEITERDRIVYKLVTAYNPELFKA